MHKHAETIVFTAAVAVTVIIAVAAGASLALIASSGAATNALSTLPGNPWWFIYQDPGAQNPSLPLIVIAAALAVTAVALVACFRARSLVHATRAPMLPYLLLFLFTLGVECLRAPLALLVATDRSLPAAIVLCRSVYGARFAGLLALLLAAVQCVDMKYRHPYVLGAGAILIAIAMAASIPIDRTVFLSQLMWKLGDEQGIWFMNLVISLLVVGAAAGGAVLKRNTRYVAFAGGLLCLLASRELLFFGASAARLAVGAAVTAAGIVLCLYSVAGLYRTA